MTREEVQQFQADEGRAEVKQFIVEALAEEQAKLDGDPTETSAGEAGGQHFSAAETARRYLTNSRHVRFGRLLVEHLLADCDAATERAVKAERQLSLSKSLSARYKWQRDQARTELAELRERIATHLEAISDQKGADAEKYADERSLGLEFEEGAYWDAAHRIRSGEIGAVPDA